MDVREKLPSEKRLIDANALIKEANSDGAYGYVDAKQIADAPTVDAVELVRCAECCHLEKGYRCRTPLGAELYNGKYILVDPEDDFCPYGERKEGDK